MSQDVNIGIIGGGQLGRMLIQAAIPYPIKCHVYDPADQAPARPFSQSFTQGDFFDDDQLVSWAKGFDAVTYEIEHISVPALKRLKEAGVRVIPDPAVLEMIQDKGTQKQFYSNHGIPTSSFVCVDKLHTRSFKEPKVMKLRRFGYDGRGVWVINKAADLESVPDQPLVIEDKVDIWKECAVTVVRDKSQSIRLFPVVESVYDPNANLVDYLVCPADISNDSEAQMNKIAKHIAIECDLEGILAIEFFVTPAGEVFVNEMAPRPHNSGHHTIEAAYSSQFDQLIRVLLNMPLGSTECLFPAAMINILGPSSGESLDRNLIELYKKPNWFVHLYGKNEWKPYRKMGHITVLSKNKADLKNEIMTIKEELNK